MISIIIPTLNEESVIDKTVRSLDSKLALPHEIIISDGRSTDHTVEIARAAGALAVVYSGQKRQTIAEGRNDGAKAARGDFLAFMDADCTIMEPDDFFGRALELFRKDPHLVAITPRIKVLPEYETWADWLFFGILNFNKWWLNNLLHRGEANGELQMVPRAAFDKVGGYRGDLVTREDADMFMRLAKIGRVRYVGSLVVYHTGRRAHKVGWPKLLSEWMLNSVWFMLFNKAHSGEWKVIR